jgi:hypothetical protein
MLDKKKVEAALKRAAHSAVHGSREERSGQFLPRTRTSMDVHSRITASTLEFTDSINTGSTRSRDDVASAFRTFLALVGSPGDFAFLGQGQTANHYFVKMASMSVDFVRQYSTRGLIKMTDASAGIGTAPEWRDEKREAAALDPDAPFGMRPAFVIPLHRLSGATDFVAIGTTQRVLQGDTARAVHLAGIYADSALNRLAAREGTRESP